mmetsp:Transcript_7867/g.17312  ORF Transcript_7867/g.17312 Transcript_7867/m.17312 type:complete len:528 (-) Transcript_7867:7-1590(-)
MALAAETVLLRQREPTHVGSRYDGQISIATGCREGQGEFAYPSPLVALSPAGGEPYFVYSGEWSEGEKHGFGRLSFADGGYYEGNFERGEIVGEGTQQWVDGEGKPFATYTGEFYGGARNGNGRYEKEDGTIYEGQWTWNKYSGQGELLLPNGDHYIGGFRTHKYDGEGKLSSENLEYEGGFQDGKFQGKGTIVKAIDDECIFEYDGQFTAGAITGTGTGKMRRSGIVHGPAPWVDGTPVQLAKDFDLGPAESSESYLAGPLDKLKEEAAAQIEPEKDPKQKKKAEAAGKKGHQETPAETPSGPTLSIQAGSPFPAVTLRVIDQDGQALSAESGRRYRITMYKERRAPPSEEFPEGDVVVREVRFGDLRKTLVDPLDAAAEADPKGAKGGGGSRSTSRKPSKSGGQMGRQPSNSKAKSSASPKRGGKKEKGKEAEELMPQEEPPAEEAAPAEPVYEGVPSIESILSGGAASLGVAEDWLMPAHLTSGVYWLRVEDTTDFEDFELSPWSRLPVMLLPVKVAALEVAAS